MIAQVYYLPLPPSVNSLFRNVPGKGRVKTRHYKKWISLATWDLVAQRRSKTTIVGPVRIRIIAARPDARRRDLDNLTKALLDLLVERAVIEDDSQVQVIASEWASDDMTGVSLTVEPIGEGTAYDRQAKAKAYLKGRKDSCAPSYLDATQRYGKARAGDRPGASKEHDGEGNLRGLRLGSLPGPCDVGRDKSSDKLTTAAKSAAPGKDREVRRAGNRKGAPRAEKARACGTGECS